MKNIADVATLRSKISEQLKTRRILGIVSITLGAVFFMAAVFLLPDLISTPTLPPLQTLVPGSYAPAQVVFKVKPNKDPGTVFTKALQVEQQVYRQKSSGKILPSTDSAVQSQPNNFTKTTLKLHRKSQRQLFPSIAISDEIKNKILSRSGAKDPEVSYRELGLDRWYVAEVQEESADVAQLLQQLQKDTTNIESAGANSFIELNQITSDVSDAVPVDSTTTIPDASTALSDCINPNDPYSCSFGHLSNSTVNDQWPLYAIKARQAWQITHGSPKTIIAVIDSGVDFRHPDLKKKIWLNAPEDVNHNGCAEYWPTYDFSGHIGCTDTMVYTGGDINGIDDDDNHYVDDINGMDVEADVYMNDVTQGPDDTVGHGTGVASVIGAETDSTSPVGIAGICWACTLMPIALGDPPTVDTIIAGLNYAALNGADIVNMSIGGVDSLAEHSPMIPVLEYVKSLGVVIVAAAGNVDRDLSDPVAPTLPANSSAVIAVGAVDYVSRRWMKEDAPDPLSGVRIGSNWGNNLSIMAPGVEILKDLAHEVDSKKTWADSIFVCPGLYCVFPSNEPYQGFLNHDYYYGTGTSNSAPIVTGIVGLMKSINPALSVDEIKKILEFSATDLTDVIDENGNSLTNFVGWDKYTGYGLVNAEAAVQKAFHDRPDFSVATDASIIATGTQQLLLNFWIENHGWTTASHVPFRLVNTDTSSTFFSGTLIADVYANSGGWLNDTINVTTPIPTHLKLVIDPDNIFSEPIESDNSSNTLTVLPYGTPFIHHIDYQRVDSATTLTFPVTATDPNTAAENLQFTTSNLPPNATFTNQKFSWTPDPTSPSEIYSPSFTVTDPDGLSSTRLVEIEYTNPADSGSLPPTISQSSQLINRLLLDHYDHSLQINVETNIVATTTLHYGLTSNLGSERNFPDNNTQSTFEILTQPNTTYYYQIESCNAARPDRCRTTTTQQFITPTRPSITIDEPVIEGNVSSATSRWSVDTALENGQAEIVPSIYQVPSSSTTAPALKDVATQFLDNTITVNFSTSQNSIGILEVKNLDQFGSVAEVHDSVASINHTLRFTVPDVAPNTNFAVQVHACAASCSPRYAWGVDDLPAQTSSTWKTVTRLALSGSGLSGGTLSNPLMPTIPYTISLLGCTTGGWCELVQKKFSAPSRVVINGPNELTAVVGTSVSGKYMAQHSLADPVTFTFTGLPAGSQFNPITAPVPSSSAEEFSWAPTIDQVRTEPYVLHLRACDALVVTPELTSQNCDTKDVSVYVRYPEITFNPLPTSFTFTKGTTLTIDVGATVVNPDKRTLTYAFLPALPGATINSTTGVFAWPTDTSLTYPSSNSVTFSVTDEYLRTKSQLTTIVIGDPQYTYSCPSGYTLKNRSTTYTSYFTLSSCAGDEYALTTTTGYGTGVVCKSNTAKSVSSISSRTSTKCQSNFGTKSGYKLIPPTKTLVNNKPVITQ